jgi:bifunctional DNase/RNase
LIEMRVTDVRRAPAAGGVPERYVVLLQEEGGERGLPIWIGPFEGTALAMILEGAELPRPQTYTLAASLLRAVGGRLREVRISRLADITYYAEVIVEGSEGTATVDARPSDAMALALLSRVPVTVSSSPVPSAEEQESWQEFQPERGEHGVGAREIAEERKSAWERDMEEFRAAEG